MSLVVADTGPINYLILIDSINLLPRLFERVVLPAGVQQELLHPAAPSAVRRWIAAPPAWLEIMPTEPIKPPAGLHHGEAAAIALAAFLRADLLLMDERKGVNAARGRGFRVTGTLGLLELAAQRLIDFANAVGRLRETSFRNPEAVLELMLRRNHHLPRP